jgi:cation diffusion facilitator family transporter
VVKQDAQWKVLIGWNYSLTADAVHALTDLVSDITTLATISYSLRPASTRFPMGYGKIESLGALGVSALLLSGGIMIGLQALMALSQQFFPEIAHVLSHVGIFEHVHHHGHSHGSADLGPNINAAWLAGGSIVVKEWLYRATIKVARQKRSSVLASNAYHHRVDSLTAFVALLTITASNFLTNAQWLDPVGGLIISGMIIQAGWVNTKTALFELSDVSFDEEIKKKVHKAAALALAEDMGSTAEIKGVQGVKSGQNILVEVKVAVPRDWTISKTDHLESIIREKIGAKVRGVRRVVVRFSSDDNAAQPFAEDFIDRANDSEPEESDHEHESDHSHDHQPNGRATVPLPNPNSSAHKRK